jgi:hypothetical protein
VGCILEKKGTRGYISGKKGFRGLYLQKKEEELVQQANDLSLLRTCTLV